MNELCGIFYIFVSNFMEYVTDSFCSLFCNILYEPVVVSSGDICIQI